MPFYTPIRLVASAWMLAAIILGSAYTSALFSQKLFNNNAPFTNLETFIQCLEKVQCRLIIPSNGTSVLLTGTGEDISNRVSKVFGYKPPLIIAADRALDAIIEEKSIYLVWLTTNDAMDFAKKGNEHSFYIVTTGLKTNGGFATRKNSSFFQAFNKIAYYFREHGLADTFRRRYILLSNCDSLSANSLKVEAHGLVSIATIFYFYICSILVAALGFFAEFLVNRMRRRTAITSNAPKNSYSYVEDQRTCN